MYSTKYDSTTHEMIILRDGEYVEHCRITETARRITELRGQTVSTVTATPHHFKADGTPAYKRAKKAAR